jgi:predicted DNA-binding transcriptional regulator AlpA
MEHQQQLFRFRQAAQTAGVSEQALRNWIRLGTGPRVTRLGKLILIDRDALTEWFASKQVNG